MNFNSKQNAKLGIKETFKNKSKVLKMLIDFCGNYDPLFDL